MNAVGPEPVRRDAYGESARGAEPRRARCGKKLKA